MNSDTEHHKHYILAKNQFVVGKKGKLGTNQSVFCRIDSVEIW